MTTKLGVRLATGATAALLIAGCQGGANTQGQTNSSATIRYVLAWYPQAEFAGLYVALKKGYFQQAGINLVIEPGGPDVQSARVLASGAADVGEADPGQILLARQHQVPLVNVFQLHQRSASLYVARNSSGIHTLHDVIGHTVGLWYGGLEVEFLAMLREQGIDPKQVRLFPQGFTMTPWLQGQYDVAMVTPWNEFQQVLARIPLNELTVLRPEDYHSAVLGTSIAVTEDYAKSHQHVLQNFLNALAQGWTYALENPDQAARIVVSYVPGADLAVQESMMRGMIDVICAGGTTIPSQGLGYLDPNAFETAEFVLAQSGELTREVPVSGSYTTQFWSQIPTQFKHPKCAKGSGA